MPKRRIFLVAVAAVGGSMKAEENLAELIAQKSVSSTKVSAIIEKTSIAEVADVEMLT